VREYDDLYTYLCDHDFLGWTRPLWDGGAWTVGDDGILTSNKRGIAVDTPWIHHGHTDWADCLRWHSLVFNVISKRMRLLFPDEDDNEPWVPSHCQNCWKTVVRPQNILQLFALNDLQSKIDRPCKCGIEPRPTVEGNYGGYFYANGYEAGHEMFRWVRLAVNNYAKLGPDVPVILKRACTEMEAECGPSDLWKTTERQLHIEGLVNRWIGETREEAEKIQPENIIIRVKRRWLEHAAAIGDMTYKAFTSGRPINKPYVTYHDREFIAEEFPLRECYG
jgi:hypothetical protein